MLVEYLPPCQPIISYVCGKNKLVVAADAAQGPGEMKGVAELRGDVYFFVGILTLACCYTQEFFGSHTAVF